jgi:glyoxylase-like metal-dependent hydrolase (beta-lactamase superfamily II)
MALVSPARRWTRPSKLRHPQRRREEPMADGFDDLPTDAPKVALEYPLGPPPQFGHSVEVAGGVHWIRMPLPFALNHINLWAIDDGRGWAVVDTGLSTDETMRMWRGLFARNADGRPMTRVFVTHLHPDHVGMAGWLTRKFGVPLLMTRLEYLTCRVMVSDTGREAPPEGIQFFRRAGWSEAAIETYRVRFGNFGKHIHALPDSYLRLHDGERLMIGANEWRVVTGSGHSPEHACLHCPALKLLISGDQVLPRISSNVSVYPTEPDADPLADWLASLAKLEREVADDVLVLPAHNEPFRGLHARLQALARGQENALGRLRRTLAEPRRVVDTFVALFGRQIDESQTQLLSLATGESVACLNHLMHRGEVRRDVDHDGVAWYRGVAAAT